MVKFVANRVVKVWSGVSFVRKQNPYVVKVFVLNRGGGQKVE